MYGGGSYPGYSSTAGGGIGGGMSSSVGPYPSEAPTGYWGHVGGHGAEVPPFLGQGAGGISPTSYGFGSTPSIVGSSIPPYSPSAMPGGLQPIGGSPLGPPLGISPQVPGYYGGGVGGGGGGGGGGGAIDANRPFNIRCDDTDGFKQVETRPTHYRTQSPD